MEDGPSIKLIGYHNKTEIVQCLQELDNNLLSFIDIPELCRKYSVFFFIYTNVITDDHICCCLPCLGDPFYEIVFRYNTKVLIQRSLTLVSGYLTAQS